MAEQVEPVLSHASHAYPNAVGLLVQTPLLTLRTSPCSAVPVIAGSSVLAGGGGRTGPTLAVLTEVWPPVFEAVTVTLT
jgi:hypothetical protein